MNEDERRRVYQALRNWVTNYDNEHGLTALENFSTARLQDSWPTLPRRQLTPGSFRPELTLKQILETKWGRDRRMVTPEMKQQAYEAYGLTGSTDPSYPPDEHGRRYQIDHLIPRQMGGADAMDNLWPMPYNPNPLPDTGWSEIHPEDYRSHGDWNPWDVVRKDIIGNKLKKEVLAGRMTIDEARQLMVEDWRIPFVEYYGQPSVNDPY